MNREKNPALAGLILLVFALFSVVCLCTNTRIDPELRSSYDRPAETASSNENMSLLLQMLNADSGSAAPDQADGQDAPKKAGADHQYGWVLGVSAVLGFALFTALLGRKKLYAAPLAAAVNLLLGFVFARLVFWLANIDIYIGQLHDFASLFRVAEGGLAMSGALLGAGLGCLLTARILRDPDLSFAVLADAMAPGAALFLACERCHEWVLLKQNFGLDASSLNLFSVQGPYGPVIATGRIASLTALVLLAVLLTVRGRRPGNRALLFLFLYSAAQILLESLRQDHHMQWNFVHAQQVFAAVAAAAALIAVCPRRWVRSLLASLLAAGLATFLEFALDGRVRPPFEFMTANVKLSWYLLFILVIAGYLAYGLYLFRACRKEGCRR